MSEQPSPFALTRDDITALKVADSVTFHIGDHFSGIRAHLDDTGRTRIYTRREQLLFAIADQYSGRAREIGADQSAMGYGGYTGGTNWAWPSSRVRGVECFHMEHGSSYDVEWQSIVRLMRPGITLQLTWVADNNNDLVRAAGLHVDELSIGWGEGAGKVRYQITRSVCADNSARMIKARLAVSA